MNSKNDAIPQPNHMHTQWKIHRARYANATSVAKKIVKLIDCSSCSLPSSHPRSTWARESDSDNEHGRG